MTPTDQQLQALARSLGDALLSRRARVVCAESCTGGWISKALTDVAGSSEWFGWGFVTYANEAKEGLLGVPPGTLGQHGAVSEAVVVAMAEGARRRAGAEFAVAVSGVAGPDGGSEARPVGTVWFAWLSPEGRRTECRRFDGDRESIRRHAVAHALEGLLSMAGEDG